MYEIMYAASIKQDIKKIDKQYHKKINNFPDVSQIKRLRSHPLVDFRLRVGHRREVY